MRQREGKRERKREMKMKEHRDICISKSISRCAQNYFFYVLIYPKVMLHIKGKCAKITASLAKTKADILEKQIL